MKTLPLLCLATAFLAGCGNIAAVKSFNTAYASPASGDTAAAVKTAYGAAASVGPHKYQGAPAEYITVWATRERSGPAARGIKYEIGMDGKVKSIKYLKFIA